jgi:hypothetical protein
MEKNFDQWNTKKKAINDSTGTALFHERKSGGAFSARMSDLSRMAGKGISRAQWLFSRSSISTPVS